MHKIELNDRDIQIIFDALGPLPLNVAGPVFTKIQSQWIKSQEEDAAYHQAVADNDGSLGP